MIKGNTFDKDNFNNTRAKPKSSNIQSENKTTLPNIPKKILIRTNSVSSYKTRLLNCKTPIRDNCPLIKNLSNSEIMPAAFKASDIDLKTNKIKIGTTKGIKMIF